MTTNYDPLILDYPEICKDCKFLTYNYDDYGEYGYDAWYTCDNEERDDEYDFPFGEPSCEFKETINEVG